MPLQETSGAATYDAFGGGVADRVYIEDVFSTYLYEGNGGSTAIQNNIALQNGASSAGWIGYTTSNANYKIAIDSSENVFTISNNSLIKYDSSGAIVWQRFLSGANLFYGLTVDSSGDIYVCGSVIVSTAERFLLVKYNTSGTVQWQRALGGTGTTVSRATSVTTDASGNVIVAGYSDVSGVMDAQIAKYNSSGTLQWQRRLAGAADYTGVVGVDVDSSGNVYIVGLATISAVSTMVFAKYNSSGTLQLQRSWPSGNTVSGGAPAIAVERSTGDVYISSSYTTGYWDFLKFNTSGTLTWQRYIRSPQSYNNNETSISLDGAGYVYLCSVMYTGQRYTAFVAKYSTSGTLQWQRQIGNSASSDWADVKATASNIFFSSEGTGGIISKLPADGSGTGVYSVGSTTVTYIASGCPTATGSYSSGTPALTSATTTLTGTTPTLSDTTPTYSSTTTALSQGVGNGGMVWIKQRSTLADHAIYDTIRGATLDLASNLTAAQTTQEQGLTGFMLNGFSTGRLAKVNTNGATYASWTFRKQAKFFDVVTYTGTGSNRTVAHNLGSVPGCIIVKRTDTTANWQVYHRSLANTEYLVLNSTAAKATGTTRWNSTTPTSTVFSLGTDTTVNANGGTYVAYLFAHDAGGFGLSGTDNVISCGSYVEPASGTWLNINLGFEAQWVMVKSATSASQWTMFDVMRDATGRYVLQASSSNAEADFGAPGWLTPTATGFQAKGGLLGSGETIIYIAIRRGPMKVPESGTEVFQPSAVNLSAGTLVSTGFPVDMQIAGYRASFTYKPTVIDRLRGVNTDTTATAYVATPKLLTSNTLAENTSSWYTPTVGWDNTGTRIGGGGGGLAGNNSFIWDFRRAPGFFDVVCDTGTGSAHTITHNLGAVPELMIRKKRSASDNWIVYANNDPTDYLILNSTAATADLDTMWNDTAPTASVFTVGTNDDVNQNTGTFVTYLFATLAGVSKVGSYTGNGSSQTIDCGFSGGARFVMIKRTDSTGNWLVADSARGIVAGNDPLLYLNSTAAEITTLDWIDADSSGFIVNQESTANANVSSATYIYFAVA